MALSRQRGTRDKRAIRPIDLSGLTATLQLMGLLSIVALFAIALCLGGMVFFAACVAPLVFSRLPAEHAGRFIRGLFPIYYLYVMGLSAVAALALLPISGVAAGLAAAVALSALWLRQVLMKTINRLSDAAQAGDRTAAKRFDRAHRLSVIMNVLQMAVLAAVLAGF